MPAAQSHQRNRPGRFLGLTPLVSRGTVAALCAAILLFWASLYVFVPILPVYAKALGAGLPMVGAVVASYAIAQLALRIPVGVWADILGRRKPFVVAGFLSAAGGILMLGLATTPWLLFGGRTITGVAATSWVAFTILFVGYFPRRQTAQAMGIVSALNGAAQVLASLLGGFTAQVWGWRTTFFVGAGLAVAALPLVWLSPERPIRRSQPFSYRSFIRMPGLHLLLVASLICLLGQFVIHGTTLAFVPVYGEGIGASRADLGLIVAVMFASSFAGSIAVVYLVPRLGYSTLLLMAFLVMTAAFGVVPLARTVLLLGLTQALVGVGRGVFFPVLMALSIQAVPSSERATAMGVFQALYAIGMLLGPLLLGLLADGLGLNSVFYVSAGLCAICGAASLAPAITRLRSQPTGAPQTPG